MCFLKNTVVVYFEQLNNRKYLVPKASNNFAVRRGLLIIISGKFYNIIITFCVKLVHRKKL